MQVSTIRREDYEVVKGHTEYEDLLQCNNLPSSETPRGHQFPAAFMIVASGLDEVIFSFAPAVKALVYQAALLI